MRKSRLVRIVCLIVAGALLTGAIAVAAVMGSPYETLKNAVFDTLMTATNFTMEAEITMTLNGVVEENVRSVVIRGDYAEVSWSYSDGESWGMHYTSDRISIHPTHRPGGIWQSDPQWYSANISPEGWGVRGTFGGTMLPLGILGGAGATDRSSASFRFMELLIDVFVGDLQNNLSMSMVDGNRRVTGEFTGRQMPEILRVGIDMMIENQLNWMNTDNMRVEDFPMPMSAPIQGVVINRVRGTADVDNDGNLTYLNAYAMVTMTDIFDRVNVAELAIVLRLTDFGTSDPDAVFGDAVEFLLDEFGHTTHHRGVFFTRNPDGAINRDSVTDVWPFGNQQRGMDMAFDEDLTRILLDMMETAN